MVGIAVTLRENSTTGGVSSVSLCNSCSSCSSSALKAAAGFWGASLDLTLGFVIVAMFSVLAPFFPARGRRLFSFRKLLLITGGL